MHASNGLTAYEFFRRLPSFVRGPSVSRDTIRVRSGSKGWPFKLLLAPRLTLWALLSITKHINYFAGDRPAPLPRPSLSKSRRIFSVSDCRAKNAKRPFKSALNPRHCNEFYYCVIFSAASIVITNAYTVTGPLFSLFGVKSVILKAVV